MGSRTERKSRRWTALAIIVGLLAFSSACLPSGTLWGVTFSGTNASAPGPVVFTDIPNGSYTYPVDSVSGYRASPAFGTLDVSGAPVNATLNFTAIPPVDYTATFTESGLLHGTLWTVTLDGISSGSIAPSPIPFPGFSNGTYSFTVGTVSGFSANPASGMLTISGNTGQAIAFTPLPPPHFNVTFTESGLPSGPAWNVTFNGTTLGAIAPASIIFSGYVRATYSFTVEPIVGYIATPASGNLAVNGSSSTAIAFTRLPAGVYTMTFTETVLTTGTPWSVAMNGTALSSNSSTIVFLFSNGTYPFVLNPVGPWYVLTLGSGNITISGLDLTRTVDYSYTSPVNFTQTSLPNETRWTIAATYNGTSSSSISPLAGTLVGQTWYANSTTASALLHLANGTYTWTISASGYQTTSGPFTVNGTPTTVAVHTSPNPPGASSSIAWWIWAILGAVIVIIIVAGLFLLMRRRGGAATTVPRPTGASPISPPPSPPAGGAQPPSPPGA